MRKTTRLTHEQELERRTLSDVLETMAGHIANVASREQSRMITGFGLHASDGTYVFVKFECVPSRFAPDDEIWDQVRLNGEWCGNRCGGVRRLAQLYATVVEAQARYDATRDVATKVAS